MAGKNGFTHNCAFNKERKSVYKNSIINSNYTDIEINIIWDFYVTHSLSNGSSLSRKIIDYGWDATISSTNGYNAIEKLLCLNANISEFCFIKAKTCKDTLNTMDLSNDFICVFHPRAVMLQDYSVSIDENENLKLESKENHILCLMRHIRNAFAHGNTYFFDNDNMLLEDNDGGRITASILIPKRSLLDWIKIIDKNSKYYTFADEYKEEN